MSTPRLTKLLKLAEADPGDPFIHYGVGLEYVNLERWADAIEAFERVLARRPDDVPALLQKGRAEIKLGRQDAARQSWSAGLSAAQRAGDRHAASELQGFLDALG